MTCYLPGSGTGTVCTSTWKSGPSFTTTPALQCDGISKRGDAEPMMCTLYFCRQPRGREDTTTAWGWPSGPGGIKALGGMIDCRSTEASDNGNEPRAETPHYLPQSTVSPRHYIVLLTLRILRALKFHQERRGSCVSPRPCTRMANSTTRRNCPAF